jgi:hypothetical protein
MGGPAVHDPKRTSALVPLDFGAQFQYLSGVEFCGAPTMADYYPVLAHAVSRLANNNAQDRQELYKHARTIADAQLSRQDLQRSASQIMRERAALERAIRRVEAESLSTPCHSSADPPARRLPAAVAVNGHDAGVRQRRSIQDRTKATQVAAQREKMDTSKNPTRKTNIDMARIPAELGKMLFGIAFFVGMTAFISVFYIRGLALVSEHVIRYPVLLVVITLMICLFIFLPLGIFREVRNSSRMSLTNSALRRGF